MLRLLLTLTLAALPAAAFAQPASPIDKGSVRLGGTISFTSQGGDLYEDGDGDRASTVLLNPSLGFFVSPGLSLGGEVLVQRQSQGDFSVTSLGIGPELAYFFGGPGSSAYPFVAVAALYTNTTIDEPGDDFSFGGFGVQLSGGATFMVARNVGLTAGAFYFTESLSADGQDGSVSGNTFGIEGGVTAFIF